MSLSRTIAFAGRGYAHEVVEVALWRRNQPAVDQAVGGRRQRVRVLARIRLHAVDSKDHILDVALDEGALA